MTLFAGRTDRAKPYAKEQQWLSWIENGRLLAQQGQWEGAAILYKQALSLAETMLCDYCPKSHHYQHSLECYLNTATEFAYIMKKNQYHNAVEMFMELLEVQLTQATLESEKSSLLAALSTLLHIHQTPQEQLEPGTIFTEEPAYEK